MVKVCGPLETLPWDYVVQGMYFGRQRYWLFSLVMPDSCIQKVQAEAE